MRIRPALRKHTNDQLSQYGVINLVPTITVQGSHTSPSTVTFQANDATGFPIPYAIFAGFRVTNVLGGIYSITVATAGSGYTSVPTVTLAAPPTGGVQATAIAVLTSMAITSFVITNPGSGYTSAPAVTITGGGGTLGAGTAVLSTSLATATNATIAAGTGTTLVETVTSTKDLTLQSSATGLFTITLTDTTAGDMAIIRLRPCVGQNRLDLWPSQLVISA